MMIVLSVRPMTMSTDWPGRRGMLRKPIRKSTGLRHASSSRMITTTLTIPSRAKAMLFPIELIACMMSTSTCRAPL